VDFDDTPAEAEFRATARAWLDQHAIPKGHPDDFSLGFFDPTVDPDDVYDKCRKWQRTLFDGGWAGISYPTELGGRGGTTLHELIFHQEMQRYGVHNGAYAVAHTMVGPAILEYGTDQQRRRYIEPMLRGDEVWCQLFSEPGSGSDLASLSTRAIRDGDEFVVNGQKVWTSTAERSDWGILLTRTDPSEARHRGITYFLIDMATPGIDIRPLRQMTGESHFSEVFLTDVRVPAANVLGGDSQVGQGWRAVMHTLANERAMIGGASTDGDLIGLIELARTYGRLADPIVRQELASAYTRTQILRYLGYRSQTALSKGRAPGPETSVMKLAFGDHLKRVGSAAVQWQGPVGMLSGRGGASPFFAQRFLYAPSLGIAGGTSEVQRNIIGERVLGLPPEPRPDRVATMADAPQVSGTRGAGHYAASGVRGPDV